MRSKHTRKPAKPRDYAAEYTRRVQNGLARGQTRSEARGHPKQTPITRPRRKGLIDPSETLEAALKDLKKGASLTRSAKDHRIAPERLRRYLHENTSVTRQGRKWIIVDERPRRFPVYSGRRLRDPILTPSEATKASDYMRAVDRFLNSGDARFLTTFKEAGVFDVNGAFLPFETSPNALFQLDAAGELSFPEIYKIVQ